MNGKVCTKCSTFKSFDLYPKYRGYHDGHRPDCKECCNARNKLKYHSDPIRQQLRTREVRRKYPETYQKWYQKNRKNKTKYKMAYRKYYKSCTPKWADMGAIVEFYRKCPEGYEVDHIIPIKGKDVCGLHVLNNLQYLPKAENRSKGNRIDLQAIRR